MPTLKRFGSIVVRMYADDHSPPHFHIAGVDFEVLLRISDLAVIAGDVKQAKIAEAIEWATSHREILALKWVELNERR